MVKEMLETKLCGLKFRNPLILASGVLGVSAAMLSRLARDCGIGGLTSKSIGPAPRKGNLNPSIIEIQPDTYFNAVGLANPGIDEFLQEIPGISHKNVPLIISIFGDSVDQYAEMASKISEAHDIQGIELNISCPHAKVSSIGADASLTSEVVEKVKDVVNLPVFVKLNPNVTDIVSIAKAAEKSGASAVVAINTIRGMAIDAHIMKPILSNKSGGVSGKAIKPMALKAVYDLYENLEIPIIGCGGIFTGLDVVEFFLAGASAVQIGTVLVRGLDTIQEINKGIEKHLKDIKISKLAHLVGMAHD